MSNTRQITIIVKNSDNVTISAPRLMLGSIEDGEKYARKYIMNGSPVSTWLRVDNKIPFRFVVGEGI